MNFPVADGHCDYLYGAVQYGYDLKKPKRDQSIALAPLLSGHVGLQFFACWTDMALKTPPLHQCVAMIDAYERMLASHPELVPLTKDYSPESGKIATVLTVEGGEAIDGSLAVLRTLYRLGVRAMTLTWNDSNELSGAAMSHTRRGLTALGREVVDEMCRLGVAVDVSHLSDAGIDDVLSRATRPVFASHSNARSVFDSPRALSDAHIRAIADMGGTVGVNFYYGQLTARRKAGIDDIVRHMVHVAEVGGVDCCAIGSDFDGMQQYPIGLRNSGDFPALLSALSEAGFTDAEIYKIAYQNLHDYILRFI